MESLRRLATTVRDTALTLPSGRTVHIPTWIVGFPLAEPPKLPPGTLHQTYTDKPLVRLDDGSAVFGELALTWWLRKDGWTAVWADTFHGGKFWSGMPHECAPCSLPSRVRALYDAIASLKGGPSGCFDVIAWKAARVVFVEYKGPSDRANKNEPFWIDAAIEAGVAESDLIFVGHKPRPTST